MYHAGEATETSHIYKHRPASRDGDMDYRPHRRRRRRRHASEDSSNSDASSLGSSKNDAEQEHTKKRKYIFSVGFAIVASIHAAHGIYQNVKTRETRRDAVEAGQITHEEAQKLKTKSRFKHLASIAIAALGVQQAYSEVKEARESRRQWDEIYEMRERRRLARARRRRRGHK